MNININNYVDFELTDTGLKILDEYNKSKRRIVPDYNAAKVSGEVYSMQLWEVMKVFGGGCRLGSESPFRFCEITIKD